MCLAPLVAAILQQSDLTRPRRPSYCDGLRRIHLYKLGHEDISRTLGPLCEATPAKFDNVENCTVRARPHHTRQPQGKTGKTMSFRHECPSRRARMSQGRSACIRLRLLNLSGQMLGLLSDMMMCAWAIQTKKREVAEAQRLPNSTNKVLPFTDV